MQLRKVGVLLDMNEGLDTLLDLAKDAEVLRDSYADIDLTSPDESEEQTGESLEETDAALSLPSAAAAARAKSADASVVLVSTGTPPVKMMSTLQNTSWNKDAGNDDATEVRLSNCSIHAETSDDWVVRVFLLHARDNDQLVFARV